MSDMWYQDMRMVSALNDQVMLSGHTDDPVDAGYKPRPQDPRWAMPLAVIALLVAVIIAAAIIIGSMKAIT